MEQLLALFLKNGLKPILFDQEINEMEKGVSRSELVTLIMLKQRGKATMSELAADLGTPLSTFTNIGQRLSKRGFIERKRDPNDQRIILVALTPSGELLADRVLARMNEILQQVKEVFTEQELEQFISLTIKAVKAVQSKPLRDENARNAATRIRIED